MDVNFFIVCVVCLCCLLCWCLFVCVSVVWCDVGGWIVGWGGDVIVGRTRGARAGEDDEVVCENLKLIV